MRTRRLVPLAAAGALLAASVAPAQAQTTDPPGEVPGSATTTGSLTVLGLDAGSLLSLDLLQDSAMANTDETVGVPAALAELTALVVESPAAGVSQSIPVVSVESTGGSDTESQELQPIDNPVLSGSILPMALSALVGDDSASSELTAGLVDLAVLDGIATLAGTDLGLGANAQGSQGSGVRGLDLDALTVLDLDALLTGLGIPLADLPLDTVLGLVEGLGLLDQLGTTLADLGLDLDLTDLSVAAISDAVAGLSGDVVDLEALAQELDVAEPVCDAADPVIGLLGELTQQDTSTLCDDVPQTVVETVDTVLALTNQLTAALEAPLDLLAEVSLLSLEGLDVSVITTATDQVSTSAAEITGTLGGLNVGGLSIGALDLTTTTEQIGAVVTQAQGALGSVLGTIDPSLTDLVTVSALEEDTSVTQAANGAVTALAEFTGLRVEVLPDVTELLALIEGLASVESIGDQLTELGAPVPVGAPGVAELNGLLEGVPTSGLLTDTGVLALTEGLTVEVASLSQASTFTPAAAPAAPEAPPALPMTGSQDTLLLLAGLGAVVLAVGARRLAVRAR